MTTTTGTTSDPPGGPPDNARWRSVRDRLFDQRVVFLWGRLDDTTASQLAAELMTLDATGDDPVQLQIDSPGGSLQAALCLVDVIDLLGVELTATCVGQAVGPGPRAPGRGPSPPGDGPRPLPPLRARLRAVGASPRDRRLGGQPARPAAAILRTAGPGDRTTARDPRAGPVQRTVPRRCPGARVRPHRRGLRSRGPGVPAPGASTRLQSPSLSAPGPRGGVSPHTRQLGRQATRPGCINFT